jgi:nicotinamidase-related amidase
VLSTRVEQFHFPHQGEIVVEKRHSGSFLDTDLHRSLADAGIDRLVIAGMPTTIACSPTVSTTVVTADQVAF